MAEHTPGAWRADIVTSGFRTYDHMQASITAGEGREAKCLAYLPELGHEEANPELAANARLIAAAPDLLAAAEAAYSDLTAGEASTETDAVLRLAIAKAKGGQ